MQKAAIFDMDGLLIDSEQHWQAAQISVLKEAGVPMTPELCHLAKGRKTIEFVQEIDRRFPINGHSLEEISIRITEVLANGLSRQTAFCPGAERAVTLFHEMGFRIAICSSSPLKIIQSALSNTRVWSMVEVVHSAEKDIRGKPSPIPYQRTSEKLRTPPSNCVALEDSIAGMSSASGAGMFVIGVPSHRGDQSKALEICDEVFNSLNELSAQVLQAIIK